MPSRSRADLLRRLLTPLPAAAVIVAESAWLTVVYGAIETAVRGEGFSLGLWTFAGAAVVGRLAARRSDAVVLGIVAAGAAVVGWLAGPGTVPALTGPDPLLALLHHPGGWLLGAGVWRGGRGIGGDAADASGLITGGLFVLTIPWLLGAAGSRSAAFVGIALPATLVFAGAGLLAVGLARLRALSAEVGTDWRDNTAWIALLAGVVVAMFVVGVPAGILLGTSVDDVARSILGPIAVFSDAASRVVGPIIDSGGTVPPITPGPQRPDDSRLTGWVFTIGTVMMAVIVAILVTVLVRAPRDRDEDDLQLQLEEHFFVLPRVSVSFARPRLGPLVRRRRRPASRTASEAYLAAVAGLAQREETARRPGESPLGHARRLRDRGLASPALVRLAADYALERYGERRLTAAETRRALARERIVTRL